MDLNLNLPVYSISGNVSVLSGFSIRNSSNTLVTINTLSDLLSNATTQTLIFGGVQQFVGTSNQCVGGTAITTSTVRVEAFPKNFNSFGNATRSTLNNCFGVGQYLYGIVDAQGNYTILGSTPGIWEVDVYPYFGTGGSKSPMPRCSAANRVGGQCAGLTNINFCVVQRKRRVGPLSLPAGINDTRTFNRRKSSAAARRPRAVQFHYSISGGQLRLLSVQRPCPRARTRW